MHTYIHICTYSVICNFFPCKISTAWSSVTGVKDRNALTLKVTANGRLLNTASSFFARSMTPFLCTAAVAVLASRHLQTATLSLSPEGSASSLYLLKITWQDVQHCCDVVQNCYEVMCRRWKLVVPRSSCCCNKALVLAHDRPAS